MSIRSTSPTGFTEEEKDWIKCLYQNFQLSADEILLDHLFYRLQETGGSFTTLEENSCKLIGVTLVDEGLSEDVKKDKKAQLIFNSLLGQNPPVAVEAEEEWEANWSAYDEDSGASSSIPQEPFGFDAEDSGASSSGDSRKISPSSVMAESPLPTPKESLEIRLQRLHDTSASLGEIIKQGRVENTEALFQDLSSLGRQLKDLKDDISRFAEEYGEMEVSEIYMDLLSLQSTCKQMEVFALVQFKAVRYDRENYSQFNYSDSKHPERNNDSICASFSLFTLAQEFHQREVNILEALQFASRMHHTYRNAHPSQGQPPHLTAEEASKAFTLQFPKKVKPSVSSFPAYQAVILPDCEETKTVFTAALETLTTFTETKTHKAYGLLGAGHEFYSVTFDAEANEWIFYDSHGFTSLEKPEACENAHISESAYRLVFKSAEDLAYFLSIRCPFQGEREIDNLIELTPVSFGKKSS